MMRSSSIDRGEMWKVFEEKKFYPKKKKKQNYVCGINLWGNYRQNYKCKFVELRALSNNLGYSYFWSIKESTNYKWWFLLIITQ